MPLFGVIARLLMYIGALFAGSFFAKLYLLAKDWFNAQAKIKREKMREERQK